MFSSLPVTEHKLNSGVPVVDGVNCGLGSTPSHVRAVDGDQTGQVLSLQAVRNVIMHTVRSYENPMLHKDLWGSPLETGGETT